MNIDLCQKIRKFPCSVQKAIRFSQQLCILFLFQQNPAINNVDKIKSGMINARLFKFALRDPLLDGVQDGETSNR